MGQLTEAELIVVAENPFGDSLREARDGLLKAEGDSDAMRCNESAHTDDIVTPGVHTSEPRFPAVYKAAVGRFFAILSASDAAISLASRTGRENLASDLVVIRPRLQRGEIAYKQFWLQSQLVINRAPDADIWAAVIDLITSISVPAQSKATRDDTPFTVSSASQQGTEQTRHRVEERIIDEIRYCTYENVEGFHAKYFTGKGWSKKADRVWRVAKKQHKKGWTGFPKKPTQDDVYRWWLSLQEELLPKAESVYYKSDLMDMIGDKAKRRVDMIVKKRAAETSDKEHKWKDVTVVGELKSSMYDWRGTVLQLSCYVRDVFTHQPRRRFVHAFALYGVEMETWIFDRSGPYSAGRFDIHLEPERFIQVLCGYVMMSDEELGLDTLVENKGGKLSVMLSTPSGKKRKLELESHPIAHQHAIVCRGTACYIAKAAGAESTRKTRSSSEAAELDCVVKFSWTSDKRQPEWKLLETAQEKGVKGVARLVGHTEVTSVGQLRDGLNFEASKRHRFHGRAASITFYSHTRSQSQSTALQSLSIYERKRKSVEVESSRPKRSRSGSFKNGFSGSAQEPEGSSLMQRNDEPFDNRVFRVLAISPAGRSIRQFTSPTELLKALRDAIKVHRSLLVCADILHRDISENNIIITDPAKADGFSGVLIDLDLAKKLGAGRSGARHRTGTMQFMAIDVLDGKTHTYRHDLESFFYVLVWLSARRAWDLPGAGKGPERSRLSGWYTGSYNNMLRTKRGDMDKQGFEDILDEITPAFEGVRPLCRKLRDILFPYRYGLFTGTPDDPESLYAPIIKAFDDALDAIRGN